MRIYVDFWIKTLDEKTTTLLKKLGYRAAVYEGGDLDSEASKVADRELTIVGKVVLTESSKDELLRKLRGIKSKRVVVSVKPLSVEVARLAARDSRVDTIVIDSDALHYIDKAQLNLMKQFFKPLELPINDFIQSSLHVKAAIYRRIHYYMLHTKNPLIISSKASTWYELYSPLSLVNLVSTLFGIEPREALLYLTTYPRGILTRIGVSL